MTIVISPAMFQMLLPMACAWAEEQEAVILRDGVALSASLREDAYRIGILHPDRVRLRTVQTIPLPENPVLRDAAESTIESPPDTTGGDTPK